jgi:hypothetical protein
MLHAWLCALKSHLKQAARNSDSLKSSCEETCTTIKDLRKIVETIESAIEKKCPWQYIHIIHPRLMMETMKNCESLRESNMESYHTVDDLQNNIEDMGAMMEKRMNGMRNVSMNESILMAKTHQYRIHNPAHSIPYAHRRYHAQKPHSAIQHKDHHTPMPSTPGYSQQHMKRPPLTTRMTKPLRK